MAESVILLVICNSTRQKLASAKGIAVAAGYHYERNKRMYIYIQVQETKSYYENGPSGRIKARLEMASGERCLIVPYREFDMSAVKNLNPRAIAMSGFGGHFQSRKIEWFRGMDEVLHEADLPIICFCGSHQVLGFSFNKNLKRVTGLRDDPIRKLKPTEDLPRRAQGTPEYDLSQYYVADGFFPIERLKPILSSGACRK